MKQVKLHPKDLNKWLERNSLGVHKQLQTYWNTDVSLPNTVISIKEITGHDPEYGILHFNPNYISKRINETIEHQICETAEQVLTAIYGEEDTHYINNQLVPEIYLECRKLFDNALIERNGQP